jgi:hypothetical protein
VSLRLLGHLATHPGHAVIVARAAWRLRRDGWWRRAPFLPLPDERYWDFRMSTAYGSSGASPSPRALVEAASWALRQPVGR